MNRFKRIKDQIMVPSVSAQLELREKIEAMRPAPKNNHWLRRAMPLAAFLLLAIGGALGYLHLRGPGGNPPNPDLSPISYESILGEGGMGFEAHMNKSAAELHRDSPAFGREGELGAMPVYRNPWPIYGNLPDVPGNLLSEAQAMEIAKKFGGLMGRTYIYTPSYWLSPEGQEKVNKKLDQFPEDRVINEAYDRIFQAWEFRCGDEKLMVSTLGSVSMWVHLPDYYPDYAGSAARYEALCRQFYEPYADAVEALTGLNFNKASTAFDYNIYGVEHFQTFFYVNNPGDTLAKQAEDYAFNRLHVFMPGEPNPQEPYGPEDAYASWSLSLSCLGTEDLIDHYPVMDSDAAKQALLDGHYEASVTATREELARATIEEVELIYSGDSRSNVFMPVYRFYLTFPPEDMGDWNNSNPYLDELGLRNYYIFYVPAVLAEYLLPQHDSTGE